MNLDSIGKYQRLSVLGHGATGIVYLAKDTLLNRLVALKEIDIHAGDVGRFLEEARLMDRLDHPNIVQVHGVDLVDGRVILDMEYVDGPNLQQILRTEGSLPQGRALNIAIQVLRALDYAHGLHVIHRDIKPANVLVGPNDCVKLVDFGLAEILATNSYVGGAGTYAYMAPEDFDEERHSDHRSDLWAVGVTLYEMLTGHRPFCPVRPKDPFAWRRVLLNEAPTPLAHYLPTVSPQLESIVAKALAREKAQRYSSAAEFLSDIRSLAPAQAADARDLQLSATVPRSGTVRPTGAASAGNLSAAERPRHFVPAVALDDAAPTIPEQAAPATKPVRRGFLQRLGISRPSIPPPLTIEARPESVSIEGVRKGDERTERIQVRLKNGGRKPVARVTGAPPWVTVRPLLLDRRAHTITLTVHSDRVWEPGDYQDFIRIEGGGVSTEIPIRVQILPPRRSFNQVAAWWLPLFVCALLPVGLVGLLLHSVSAMYLVPAALLSSALLMGMLLLVSNAADLGVNERYACGFMMAFMLMALGAIAAAHNRLMVSPLALAGVGVPIGVMLLVQVFTAHRWKFWAAAVGILALVTCSSFVRALSP